MAEKVLRTYQDLSRKESFRKGKIPKGVIFPDWWKKQKKKK